MDSPPLDRPGRPTVGHDVSWPRRLTLRPLALNLRGLGLGARLTTSRVALAVVTFGLFAALAWGAMCVRFLING